MANATTTLMNRRTATTRTISPQRVRTIYSLTLLLMDAAGIVAAFSLAYMIRQIIPLPEALPTGAPQLFSYRDLILLMVGSIITIAFTSKHYYIPRAPSRVAQIYQVFASVSIGILLTIALATFFFKSRDFVTDFPRAITLYTWALAIIFLSSIRIVHQWIRGFLRGQGIGVDRLLLIGMGSAAKNTVAHIKNSPHLGYDLIGVVGAEKQSKRRFLGLPVHGTLADLPRLLEELMVNDVIIAMPERRHREVKAAVEHCQLGRVSIKIFPDVFDYNTEEPSIDDLGKFPLLTVSDFSQAGHLLLVKRLFDFSLSLIGLILFSPIMILVAVLIKLESSGPAFFVQERMGLDGREFQIFKFRSMRQDAEENGPGWTVQNDPRRTRLGAILRKTNFDELPQLINVLMGEMSLVGPRPEQPYYVEQFRTHIPGYMARHQLRAGITGWAQVNGLRGDTSIENRTQYDLEYTRRWSLGFDIQILVRTIWQTISGQNHGAG